MSTKTRLDMEHGFVKSIIKIQVDRDTYDKEVKSQKSQTPTNTENKSKKYEQLTYIPPKRRQMMAGEEDVCLFLLEYEDQNRQIHTLRVRTTDDPVTLARDFSSQLAFTPPMTRAFTDFLRSHVRQALHERNT